MEKSNNALATEETIEIQRTSESEPKDREGLLAWINKHKTLLTLVGISIPSLIAIAMGVKNKEALSTLWKNISDEISKANVFSSKWFEKATREELLAARELVQAEYGKSGGNFELSCQLQRLLNRIDAAISKIDWAGRIPSAPSYPREHGHSLYKPD